MECVYKLGGGLNQTIFCVGLSLHRSRGHAICIYTLSTIRRHEEEAKQFLGERLYGELDQMIYDLMDGGRYYNMASVKHGLQVHSGNMERARSLNVDEKENKLKLPPYKGKLLHEIFS